MKPLALLFVLISNVGWAQSPDNAIACGFVYRHPSQVEKAYRISMQPEKLDILQLHSNSDQNQKRLDPIIFENNINIEIKPIPTLDNSEFNLN